MEKRSSVGIVVLLSLGLGLLVQAKASSSCSGLSGCDYDKVVVLRCETREDGSIKVRNSSATSATGVTIQRGNRCAATISALLQAGLEMSGPRVTPISMGAEVSLSFVFFNDDDDDDSSSEDDDDEDDDD